MLKEEGFRSLTICKFDRANKLMNAHVNIIESFNLSKMKILFIAIS